MGETTLLIVDDDPGVRELYRLLLASYGYRVIAADSGHQALDFFHSKSDIAAVVTDYEMPGMNGAEFAAVVKRFNPRMPVIMVSGSPPPAGGKPPCFDVAIEKGLPVAVIVDHLELLLKNSVEAQTSRLEF
ncbi:MAG: response regulator [Acidobacteriales bacterium]|nr:response regulator [Terriglobales bacterium]